MNAPPLVQSELPALRPVPLAINPDHVPQGLRQVPNWVLWKHELRDGDWTKVPINARTGRRAATTRPTSWVSFDDAVEAYKNTRDKWGIDGIGIVFDGNDLVGIDLDECVINGTLVPAAQEIVNRINSYSEISPSGQGIKIYIRGTKPQGVGCKSRVIAGYKETEVYDNARFFAVTGARYEGVSPDVEARQQELDELCGVLFPAQPQLRLADASSTGFEGDDLELITQAQSAKNGHKFNQLWNGETSQHGSDDSRADLALCTILAFWCGADEMRIDRLFRRSGLYREKWERADYRDRTIKKAIETCRTTYSPKPPPKSTKVKDLTGDDDLDGRVEIVIGPDEHRVVDEAINALQTDPEVYQRGALLVRAVKEKRSKSAIVRRHGSVTINAIPTANLRERLTRCAHFLKVNKQGDLVDAHPTGWMVKAVEARHTWDGIRSLMAIADTPILRPDGSICQVPGYDEATEVLLLPGQQFPDVPDDVDIDDAIAAMETLFEIIFDFRFEAPEHKSGWLAGLLTPIGRYAFSGPSPLFLVDANVRGAGKGKLIQTIGHVVQGHEMPASSYAHETEEMRKKITSIAIAGDRMINLDNLEGTFGNDSLDRALTTTRWKDRVLGKNDLVDLPLFTTWFASGNNVLVGADTSRRLIHIRLDVLEERPELRSGFRHPNLIPWIDENRPRLLVAALTILRAYCRAGCPKQQLDPFGSFEGWSDLIRSAVVWLGLPDPCKTQLKLAEVADTAADGLRQLFQAWELFDPTNDGIVLSTLVNRLYAGQQAFDGNDEAAAAMRAAIENLLSAGRGKSPTAKQIGNKLRHFRRRVVDGLLLDFDEGSRRMGARWKLKRKDAL